MMQNKKRGGVSTPSTDEDGSSKSLYPTAGEPSDTNHFDGLTDVGILCQEILSTIERCDHLPSSDRTSIAKKINALLSLHQEKDHKHNALKAEFTAVREKLRRANEANAVLRQELFGPSSEAIFQYDDGDSASNEFDEDLVEEVSPKPAGKSARKFSANIEQIVHHNYPENRTCCTCGNEMPSIGKWQSQHFEIVPEHVKIVTNIHHTCACNRGICKENKPVTAKAKGKIMKRRSMDVGFVLEAAIQKFSEHIPTYRMERRLRYSNINLSRQAIGRNIALLSDHLAPIREALSEHTKNSHVAHMDETPIRVLQPGTGKCAIGQIWAIGGNETGWNQEAKPAVAFFYAPTRSGKVAAELLDGASLKFLTTDGYTAYNKVFTGADGSNDQLRSVRCWAHTRRKFHEAWIPTRSKLAGHIIQLIRDMYAVERAAKGQAPDERALMRQRHSLPRLDEMALLHKSCEGFIS